MTSTIMSKEEFNQLQIGDVIDVRGLFRGSKYSGNATLEGSFTNSGGAKFFKMYVEGWTYVGDERHQYSYDTFNAYKFRKLFTTFEYDPNQQGDTEEDI